VADSADQLLEIRVESADDAFLEGIAVGGQFGSDIEAKLVDGQVGVLEFDLIEIGVEVGPSALFRDGLGALG
jgi:hypothetical protein